MMWLCKIRFKSFLWWTNSISFKNKLRLFCANTPKPQTAISFQYSAMCEYVNCMVWCGDHQHVHSDLKGFPSDRKRKYIKNTVQSEGSSCCVRTSNLSSVQHLKASRVSADHPHCRCRWGSDGGGGRCRSHPSRGPEGRKSKNHLIHWQWKWKQTIPLLVFPSDIFVDAAVTSANKTKTKIDRNGARLPAWLDHQSPFDFPWFSAWWQTKLHSESEDSRFPV